MSDSIIVKLQRDLTGTKVLITDESDGTFLRECVGDEATRIADCYALDPMGRTFCKAEIDANGMIHLGNELEDQP